MVKMFKNDNLKLGNELVMKGILLPPQSDIELVSQSSFKSYYDYYHPSLLSTLFCLESKEYLNEEESMTENDFIAFIKF